jgi:hypothetical protein
MSRSVKQSTAPLACRIWILSCALLSAGGWLLSAVGQVNPSGYVVVVGVGGVIVWLALRPIHSSKLSLERASAAQWDRGGRFGRLRRRFRRPLPLAFLALALLAILGGALHPPSNWDALAFRTPRVLHWLTEGRWHWMTDFRGGLNTRTCGFEWVTAPFLLFLKTDRWLFLLNGVSFLLMPGLVFSLFTRLGVPRRAVWSWMWVLPAGLCYVMQAGSLANDLFGVVFALAALDFALRARAGQAPGADLRYSLLAAALMTGAKLSNILLGLPWLLVMLTMAGRIVSAKSGSGNAAAETHPPKTLWEVVLHTAALALALMASFLPTAWFNCRHSGDWTGAAAEIIWTKPPSRVTCFVHNTALLTVQHLAPPVFPFASAWDRFVQQRVPESWKKTLDDFAEEGRNSYRVRELPMEEHAGLGLGVVLLVVAQLGFTLRRESWKRFRDSLRTPRGKWGAVILVSPYASLAFFMCKSGLVAISRIISPFYALLLPLLLMVSDSQRAVRTWWWRGLAALAFAFAFIALLITPARPVLPVAILFRSLQKHFPSPLLERASTVYSVYGQRHDVFSQVRQAIPASAQVVGLVTIATPETSLWRPLGERRVVRLSQSTSREEARSLGVDYVVVETDAAARVLAQPLDPWLASMRATVVTNIPVRLLASQPPIDFSVVRLAP